MYFVWPPSVWSIAIRSQENWDIYSCTKIFSIRFQKQVTLYYSISIHILHKTTKFPFLPTFYILFTVSKEIREENHNYLFLRLFFVITSESGIFFKHFTIYICLIFPAVAKEIRADSGNYLLSRLTFTHLKREQLLKRNVPEIQMQVF